MGLLNFFILNLFISTSNIDIPIRTNLEDFFLLNFFFFWTSAHYLLPFIGLALITMFFLLTYFHSAGLYVPLYILLFYLSSIVFLNSGLLVNLSTFSLENYKVNLLLTNKVNKIHPFLFYISFFTFFIKPGLGYLQKFQITYIHLNFSLWCIYATSTLLLSLYLGSWWALQEGSWGGWWNWDPSEVFGIFLFYILMRGYHVILTTNSLSNLNYFFTFYGVYVLLYYFLMQLNFTLIAHNFGFRKKYFFFEKFLLGGFIFFCLISVLVNEYLRLSSFKHINVVASKFSVFTSFYLLCTFFILALAPLTLFNYNLYLGSLTSVSTSTFCFMLLMLHLTLTLITFSASLFLIFTIFTSYLTWFILIIAPFKINKRYIYYHLFSFVILFLIYFLCNKTHSWVTLGLSNQIQNPTSYLTLNTLFMGEGTSIELLTKTHSYKIFSQTFIDKFTLQTLILSGNTSSPPLNTIDYTVPYFSFLLLYFFLLNFLIKFYVLVL